MYFIHGFQWRRQREEAHEAVTDVTTPPEDTAYPNAEILKTKEITLQIANVAHTLEYNESKAGQLSLF